MKEGNIPKDDLSAMMDDLEKSTTPEELQTNKKGQENLIEIDSLQNFAKNLIPVFEINEQLKEAPEHLRNMMTKKLMVPKAVEYTNELKLALAGLKKYALEPGQEKAFQTYLDDLKLILKKIHNWGKEWLDLKDAKEEAEKKEERRKATWASRW